MKFFTKEKPKTEFVPIIFDKGVHIPMTIKEVEEKQTKTGVPMYVFRCTINEGEHKGRKFSIPAVVIVTNRETGEEKFSYSFKAFLRGFQNVITSLPKTTEDFNKFIPELVGRKMEAAFFDREGDFQSIMYIKDLGGNDDTTTDTTTTDDSDDNVKVEETTPSTSNMPVF